MIWGLYIMEYMHIYVHIIQSPYVYANIAYIHMIII